MDAATGRNHTMRTQAVLRRQILAGELPGGTRLYEVALAERLDVSRTPVREAMARLVEEGLLERGPKGGFAVRAFETADVLDTIELRGVMEGMAARLAAERGADPAALAGAQEVLARLDACFAGDETDFDAYAEANREFHALLARLAGSATLERELERIARLPFGSPSAFLPFRMQAGEFRDILRVGQHEHRMLVEAILRRQGARAEALAREHVRPAQENFRRLFGRGDAPPLSPAMALDPPAAG
ncbi:GntR family transcriptional regulator [Mangrovicoccus algicola]|uniref:GntR family transcriptional regulator n=1 Tax=Mangrovicoccus algicola TaxID=2771008 RepID=A0A8J7CXU5_9RHOB|nr:GntR family transcriptional regulator [Mangrovicoccus algicola]MBE3639252.1 GntR family transcriptional regulator [Mangrovicoccus algicola]